MYSQQEPEYLLIQPTARHESAAIDREMELIASHCGHRFVMAAFWVDDWALGLMPWHDDAVSRREAVGQHGTDTLRYVCDVLMPWLGRHYGPLPVVLGGYSLGGLFALWASCLCEGICGVAAASPSVWIEGWMEFGIWNILPSRISELIASVQLISSRAAIRPLPSAVGTSVCEITATSEFASCALICPWE